MGTISVAFSEYLNFNKLVQTFSCPNLLKRDETIRKSMLEFFVLMRFVHLHSTLTTTTGQKKRYLHVPATYLKCL